jgi:hypothetical protein
LDQFDQLERLRDAGKWEREIARERQFIAQALAGDASPEPAAEVQACEPPAARRAA